MYRIGLIGYGMVGKGTEEGFSLKGCEIKIQDPQLGYMAELRGCDFIFISVPVPTYESGQQDISILETSLLKARFEAPEAEIFIRSSVLPGTVDKLRIGFQTKKIHSMPEFLTERTWKEDSSRLPVVTSYIDYRIENLYSTRSIIVAENPAAAEMIKYTHNSFAALKVEFFNQISDKCEEMGIDYSEMNRGLKVTPFISEYHRNVPGPDGKKGFGGKCLPKDIKAFSTFLDSNLLKECIKKNDQRRDESFLEEEPQIVSIRSNYCTDSY